MNAKETTVPKIQVGDLVCMYRRKNKGMGIVLEHAEDVVVAAQAGITFDEFMETLEDVGHNYSRRAAYRMQLCESAKYPDKIDAALRYNASWAKKPKKEFVRIRWFTNPSMYEINKTTELEQWYPIDWVKRI